MSALIAHARAARALERAFTEQARRALINDGKDERAALLQCIGAAHGAAAEALEALARSEMTGNPTKGTTNDDPPR